MTSTLLGLPLRGRDDEMARALRVLEADLGGKDGLLVVEGRPGTGKTRLLHEITAVAERLGMKVVRESPLDRRCGSAATSEQTGPAGGGSRTVRPSRVLFVADDGHLVAGGGGSALLARRDRVRDTSVLWLVARRTGMGPGSLDVLMANPQVVSCWLELGPVAPEQALRLAGDVLGAPPSRELSRVLARTGGNPRLLVELSRGLREEGSVQVAGGQAELLADQYPKRLRDLVTRMLSGCSDRCRQLLTIAAVLDGRVEIERLVAMMDASPSSLLPVLDEACRVGVLRSDGAGYAFCGDLVWQLIADMVPAELRAALLRQSAEQKAEVAPGCGELPASAGAAAPKAERRPLNDRQRRIVGLVEEGLTNRQIATRLDISVYTVNYHLRNIYRIYGVNSRVALLREVRAARVGAVDAAGGTGCAGSDYPQR